MNQFEKLKMKWGIQSNWDFFIINLVFAMAGMSVVFVRKPLFPILGITVETPFWIKFFTWLLIVFPTYQLSLLIFGTLLGQFSFFWEKEKQIGRFLVRLFTGTKKPVTPHDIPHEKTYSIK